MKNGGFGAFWRRLIDANRKDGIVSQTEWLGAVDRASGDPSLSRSISAMAERGVADPKAEIASLFRRAGIAFEEDRKGALRLK